ncbi:hypothetical protein B0H10DRAFT_1989912 [Mycena sp. CBHHK59/15]|nr:hypothetical protein B0H10DRAFT_1989912 [Mycena sp. CBHHK59/15]
MKDLDRMIASSTRLYLLHDHLEPLEEEPPRAITVVLRHYLTLVNNHWHRKALTQMLLSQHCLAVEHLRHPVRYHKKPVPRDLHLCRFGCASVETVEHALFFCDGSPDVSTIVSVSPVNTTDVLKQLVFNKGTVCTVAKLVHQVFSFFDREPLLRPAEDTF